MDVEHIIVQSVKCYKIMLICITGIPGSGKTTILNKLKDDYKIIILDNEIHKIYQKNEIGYNIILQYFGKEFVNEIQVDRHKLGKLVFTDNNKLNQLNDLLEPIIKNLIQKIKNSYKNEIVLIEAAALLENYKKYFYLFDQIILITAPFERIVNILKYRNSYISNELLIKWLNISKNIKFNFIINNDSTITNSINNLKNYLKDILLK